MEDGSQASAPGAGAPASVPDPGPRLPPRPGPRIPPGTAADIGRLNHALARVAGASIGGGPPNIFTTLARHRGLFRRWLRFAGALMPGGLLPRADTELLILRVAHNAGSQYEWRHHERLAKAAGLTAEEIERVREGPAPTAGPRARRCCCAPPTSSTPSARSPRRSGPSFGRTCRMPS